MAWGGVGGARTKEGCGSRWATGLGPHRCWTRYTLPPPPGHGVGVPSAPKEGSARGTDCDERSRIAALNFITWGKKREAVAA